MRIGFGKSDITPRVGVELCGFGPFRCRHSIGIRDALWARAMAVEIGDRRAIVISCDLIGVPRATTHRVRALLAAKHGLPEDAVMVCCTHTHSGPATAHYIGWGEADMPYLELLPRRIAAAADEALASLREATLSHAEVPCEGVGLNREYDKDAPPLEEVLADSWRPAKPELTDTTCHVLRADADGKTIGFASYFGCHPVVCCSKTRWIHGDYCGVATNLLEQEMPGATGLFFQGANGDVNSCVVHKPEEESLKALDIIAERYARAVREGLRQAVPVDADRLACERREIDFSRKPWGLDELRARLAEQEALLHADDASDRSQDVRMAMVYAIALRRLIARMEAGEPLEEPTEVYGLRLGPIALLGSGFETFQAIKNEIANKAKAPIPLVMSVMNDTIGYAPDHTAAARGGYAADMVPLIGASRPYANAHDELVAALLEIDAALENAQ